MARFDLILKTRVSVMAVCFAATCPLFPTWAQDNELEANEPRVASNPVVSQTQAPELEEIIVTGSRIGRSSFNSPTPVHVIGEERLNDLGITSVADALNQLPSFRAVATPTSTLFRATGTIGANSVDLRGLGSSRTLVLVDGRRFVPGGDNGTVDLNGIPSALVKRTEVVTAGASAAYGANAVAGVVNLILDTDFIGIKADVNYGISEEGDDENFFASLAGGTEFAGGRGHVVAGIEYQKNYGVGSCDTRDWCRKYTNFISNPGYIGGVSTNGLPATILTDDVRFVYNRTGILVSAVTADGTRLGQQINSGNMLDTGLRDLQFNQDGSALVPFQFGDLLSGIFMKGGDSSVDTLFGFGVPPLRVPTSHLSAMAHAEYEISNDLNFFGEILFSNVQGGPAVAAYLNRVTTLNIDNPFIQQSVRDQILAVNPDITAIQVNTVSEESGLQNTGTSENNIWRAVVGLDGRIFGDWSWDVSYVHGETHSKTDVRRQRTRRLESEGPNAITPPANYSGPIYSTPEGLPVICASSVGQPNNGCLPVNYLGLNSLTPDVVAFYFRDGYQTRVIKQDAAAINFRGDAAELWAGPLTVAVGAEWRRDTAVGEADMLTVANAFTAPATSSLPFVKQSVIEGYLEASLPVIEDLVTLDGAVRQTHYNVAGNATTWKAGLVVEPTSDFLIRVTKSRDVRAPTPAELNPNTNGVSLPLPDPFAGGTRNIINVTGGNPDLGLEKADTFTVGAVLTPGFLPNFRMSVDYYNIDVGGGIDSLSATAIIDKCFNESQLCDLIEFSGAPRQSGISRVFSNFQNLSTLKAEGLEFVAQYSFPVGSGDVNLSMNANYVIDLKSIDAIGNVTQFDGITGNVGSLTNTLGVPRYKIDGVVTYAQPSWSITVHGRYIPESILDPTKIGPDDSGYDINLPNSVNVNTVSSRFYLDLSASLQTGIEMFGPEGLELYAGIYNTLDTHPPGQLRFFGNPLHYDVVGRSFRLGVRSDF